MKRIFGDVAQRGIFDHIIMITHLDTVKQSWYAHWLSVQKLDGKISGVISGPTTDASEEIPHVPPLSAVAECGSENWENVAAHERDKTEAVWM